MGNECSVCCFFMAFIFLAGHPGKAPLISCYTAVSLGRAEKKNDKWALHLAFVYFC